MKKTLVVLTGPTAVGKTKLSISLAKALNGEIISADSMQVYKYMDIGSAKITEKEMDGVPHHLIDVLSPFEEFHIVRFQELAKKAMEDIYSRGRIPVFVGGTGFYIQAITKDIDFTESEEDKQYREELSRLAAEKGNEFLHEMLREVDKKSAEEIHANNVKRVIRALEFYKENGFPISQHNEEQKQNETPYNLAYFVLNAPRDLLYERIDRRVDEMMKNGLVKEVQKLKDMGCRREMTSMQGLGYKEILSFLDGEIPLDEAVRILKRDTRHFAKRQLTWFRRESNVVWVDKDKFAFNDEKILEYMLSVCRERKIIE